MKFMPNATTEHKLKKWHHDNKTNCSDLTLLAADVYFQLLKTPFFVAYAQSFLQDLERAAKQGNGGRAHTRVQTQILQVPARTLYAQQLQILDKHAVAGRVQHFWKTSHAKYFLSPHLRGAVRHARQHLDACLDSRTGEFAEDEMEARLAYVHSARQATLVLKKEELQVHLTFQFRPEFPIRTSPPTLKVDWSCPLTGASSATGDGGTDLDSMVFGVPMKRFRNWWLASQKADVVAGGLSGLCHVWVKNFASHFHGVEDCMICYSAVHSKTHEVPRKRCPTCKNKFHAPCIAQWFKSSGKTVCPLCKCPF